MHPTQNGVATVARALCSARRVLALTGAGISADSGLPTYRGVAGLYAAGPDSTGRLPEEVLSATTWRRDPDHVWAYIRPLALAIEAAAPNAGHDFLVELEARTETLVVTQNIDALHARAGSRRVVELHGRLHRLRCESCRHREEIESFDAHPVRPPCPGCGALLRPDVVFFEEFLDPEVASRLAAFAATPVDVVLVVGTTAQFAYIVRPIVNARATGGLVVEVNPQPTLGQLADVALALGARDAFTEVRRAMRELDEGTAGRADGGSRER